MLRTGRVNIEKAAAQNTFYRRVISTNEFQQVALMSLIDGEDIPKETHAGSQFIRVESGRGSATVGKRRFVLHDGVSLVIGPGEPHYIRATAGPLKLYTVYSPPEHPAGTKQRRQL